MSRTHFTNYYTNPLRVITQIPQNHSNNLQHTNTSNKELLPQIQPSQALTPPNMIQANTTHECITKPAITAKHTNTQSHRLVTTNPCCKYQLTIQTITNPNHLNLRNNLPSKHTNNHQCTYKLQTRSNHQQYPQHSESNHQLKCMIQHPTTHAHQINKILKANELAPGGTYSKYYYESLVMRIHKPLKLHKHHAQLNSMSSITPQHSIRIALKQTPPVFPPTLIRTRKPTRNQQHTSHPQNSLLFQIKVNKPIKHTQTNLTIEITANHCTIKVRIPYHKVPTWYNIPNVRTTADTQATPQFTQKAPQGTTTGNAELPTKN
eukprot:gene3564-2515_t